MTRESFDRDLRKLQDRLLALGSEVEENILKSVKSLLKRDAITSKRIVNGDEAINREQIGIERECLVLIARQQPTAGDLRLIASVIAVAGELERINDYAKGIAKINLLIGQESLMDQAAALQPMADEATNMLRRGLEAFFRRDVEAAQAIFAEDDKIDEMYNAVYRRLVDAIIADHSLMDQATHLLWAAHNLERTADRVGNICERVVFVVSGQIIESPEEMEIAFPQ